MGFCRLFNSVLNIMYFENNCQINAAVFVKYYLGIYDETCCKHCNIYPLEYFLKFEIIITSKYCLTF